jgi:DNA-binding beta-propeller fold protein YncE
VALDASGNLYIAEFGNRRIRKVAGGTISTVAGGGSGQGAVAPQTMFVDPRGVTKDQSGNWYVSDQLGNRLYRVDPSGTPSMVAGTGSQGPSLNTPGALAVDSAGALFIADYARIQKISATATVTVAGNYRVGYSGDGGLAIAASLGIPSGLAFGSSDRKDRDPGHRAEPGLPHRPPVLVIDPERISPSRLIWSCV